MILTPFCSLDLIHSDVLFLVGVSSLENQALLRMTLNVQITDTLKCCVWFYLETMKMILDYDFPSSPPPNSAHSCSYRLSQSCCRMTQCIQSCSSSQELLLRFTSNIKKGQKCDLDCWFRMLKLYWPSWIFMHKTPSEQGNQQAEKTLFMRKVKGEWRDWLELKGRQE